jgi:hypothetical protein
MRRSPIQPYAELKLQQSMTPEQKATLVEQLAPHGRLRAGVVSRIKLIRYFQLNLHRRRVDLPVYN